MRKQERVRFIMTGLIALLAIAILALVIVLFNKKSCSNAVNSGFLNEDDDPKHVIGSNDPDPADPQTELPTEAPEATPDLPAVTDGPTATPPVITQPPASAVPGVQINDPGVPSLPQSPYPAIPYVVTTGSFADVKARLEQLKTLPKSATIVLLDVGHGGFDGGTVGIDTGVTEANINLEIARYVAQWLGSKGYYVFMTRTDDYAVGSTKNNDMKWRKQVMKLDIFDISISIHQNALASDRNVHGARIYCYKKGTAGEQLAKEMIAAISSEISTVKQNVYADNLMVVREPVCPAVLIECGFLSNHDEELLLQNPAYQRLLAKLIAQGAEKYLNK